MKKHRLLWLVSLIFTVGWLASIYYGPVHIDHHGDDTVYTHNYLVRFAFVIPASMAGTWLAFRHLLRYGWGRTFRTDYTQWDADMRDSAIGLSLFAFGVVFLFLTTWSCVQADYLAVSAAGIREGSGAWTPGAPQVRFQDFQRIDLNHRDATAARRGRCLRFVGAGNQEKLMPRESLVNAAVPQIVAAAQAHGVEIANE